MKNRGHNALFLRNSNYSNLTTGVEVHYEPLQSERGTIISLKKVISRDIGAVQQNRLKSNIIKDFI